jgi:hypothetical protein
MSASELVKCKHCNSMLNPKNVAKHLRKIHRLDQNGLFLPPVVKDGRKKYESLSPVLQKAEPMQEICPVCCGDGGVNGGCYKCDGSGWVSSASRAAYRGTVALPVNRDNSRISNAYYLGANPGAHYRDRDGRFGSNPEYDDFSDEGTA